jgi:uncharacterized metal-binding protein (TIGR02443 family)
MVDGAMKCPVCHAVDSRVMHTDGSKRRRECAHCRHRWSTVELPVENAKATAKARELAQQLLAALPENTV